MKYNFCIPADIRYIHKALALCDSIELHCGKEYSIWILCLDATTKKCFLQLGLKNLIILEPEDLNDRELMENKHGRSPAEFSWTCKPPLITHVLNQLKSGDIVAYLDADLFFFYSPEKVYKKFAGKSIIITPHNFSLENKDREQMVGRYNAGVIFFSKTETAFKCLARWRKQCLDWCYATLNNGRLGDQMYLDEWLSLYGNEVLELSHAGVNVGSWNIENYKTGNVNDTVYVDDKPLILFHFHHFKTYLNNRGILNSYPILTGDNKIYAPYMQALRNALKRLSSIKNSEYAFLPDKNPGLVRLAKQYIIKYAHKLWTPQKRSKGL